MRPSPMFISCGLFLILLSFTPFDAVAQPANTSQGAQPGNNTQLTKLDDAKIKMDPAAPMFILHGEYHLSQFELHSSRPAWASVWKVDASDLTNGAFSINFWPPKYCHAIYVCLVPTGNYNEDYFFVTKENTCEAHYVKYFPHIKKILTKQDVNDAEVENTLMSNRLDFDIDTDYKGSLRVLEKEPSTFAEWQEEMAKEKKIPIDLKGKDILVLTNSRMCQVNKPGTYFYPFFQSSIREDTTDKFPNWFHNMEQIIRTDTLPPNQAIGRKKDIDLLAYLRDLEWSTEKLGGLKKKCGGSGKTTTSGSGNERATSLFKKVSVNSYQVSVEQANYVGRSIKQLTLRVPSCQWFRIWVSVDDDIKDYKDKLDLSNTIDVFLSEGFYITPESNVAHPLPSISDLTVFTFRAQKDENKDRNLVEMSYGDHNGKRLYYEHFNMPIMQQKNFHLHIIKAKGCDLTVVKELNTLTDYTYQGVNQMWSAKQCKFSYFKEP